MAAAALLALGLQAPAVAVTYTWVANPASGNWNSAGNWVGNALPVSATDAGLIFGASSRSVLQQNLDSFNLLRMDFSSQAANYTINGSTLRFEGNSTQLNVAAGSQVLNTALVVSGRMAINNATSLALNGRLFNTAGNTPVITKSGAGLLTLGGDNAYAGTLEIAQGALLVNHANGLLQTNLSLQNTNTQLSFGALASATVDRIGGAGQVLLGSTTLNITGSGDSALGGIVSGSGGLNKTGSGGLALSRANTFTGAANFVGGVVNLLDGRALQFAPVTLGSNAELTFQFVSSAFMPSLAGSGKVTLQNVALTLDGSSDTSYSGSLTGTGSILKSGSAAWTVGSTGPYSGVLTIAGGRVLLGTNGALNAASIVVNVDGGLDLNGHTASFAALTGSGALSLGADPARTLTVNNTVAGTYSGVISGAGGVIKNGAGNWTLSAANTFSGGFAVQQGLVELTQGQAVRNNIVTVQSGAALRFLNLPTASVRGLAGAGLVRIDNAILTLGLASDTAAQTVTFAGQIVGDGSIVKTGAATWALASQQAYAGDTVINGGRILVQHASALAQSRVQLNVDDGLQLAGLGAVNLGGLAGNGALSLGSTDLFVYVRPGADDIYTGSLRGGAGSSLVVTGAAGLGSLTLRNIPAAAGAVQPLLPTLNARDQGKLVLDNVRGSIFVATAQQGVSTAGGDLRIVGGSALAVGAYEGADTSACGSVMRGAGGVAGLLSIAGAGSSLTCAPGATSTFSVFTGGEVLLSNRGLLDAQRLNLGEGTQIGVAGGSALRATDVNFSGGDVADSAVLLLGGTGSNAQLTGTVTLQGRAPGSAMLKLDEGAYASVNNLDVRTGGGVALTGNSALDVRSFQVLDSGSIELDTPSRFTLVGASNGLGTHGGGISGSGELAFYGGGYRETLDLSDAFFGGVTVGGGAILTVTGNAITRYEALNTGQFDLARGNLGFAMVSAQTGGTVRYLSRVVQGGLLLGAGTHDISRVAQFSGSSFASGVTLAPATGATLIGVSNSGQLNILAGRSVRFTAGSNQGGEVAIAGTATVASWQSEGGRVSVTGTLNTVATGGDLRFFGGAQLALGTAAAHGGVLTLAGATRLQLNGALLVNNGTINGPVVVNFGSLAKGAGVFNGSVTLNDGGRFSPGNSPGVATTGDAIWGQGGGYVVELLAASGAAGTAWDLWNVNGALSVTAGTTANSVFTVSLATLDASDSPALLAGFNPGQNYSWTILHSSAGIAGFDAQHVALNTSGFANPLHGGSFALLRQGNDLVLNFTAAALPVPEPATWLMWGLGLAGVLTRGGAARRRRA